MSTHGEIIELPEDTENKGSLKSFLKYIFSSVIAALIIAVLLRLFVMNIFYVPTGSMVDTIEVGSRIVATGPILNMTPMGSIDNGDIVIFDNDKDWKNSGTYDTLVKRVIGTGGDTVEGLSDGTILVNNKTLEEDYIIQSNQIPFEITVPEGELWVMGDNRGNSSDSRSNIEKDPFISENSVSGVVFYTIPRLPDPLGLTPAH